MTCLPSGRVPCAIQTIVRRTARSAGRSAFCTPMAGGLSFPEGGEAREALIEAGAQVDDISFIEATYRSERGGVLSDRKAVTRSPFLRDVLHRMAQVGLEDTSLNRDAAMEEMFRARADTLLASSDDPRKPKLTATSRAEQTRVKAGPGTRPPLPSVIWQADPAPSATAPAPMADTALPPIVSSEPPSAQQTIAEVSPPKTRTARKDLPLSEFNAQVEKLVANHRDDWEDDTASDVRVLVAIFRGILEEHGVTHSGEITQEHVAALRQHFNHILPLYGRSPHLRALSPAALREESSKRAEDAKLKGETLRLGLRPATIRRHLGNLDHFLKHLRASHFLVPD